MNIQLKYFGMIAEATNLNEENVEISTQNTFTTVDLSTLLQNKYPQLKELNFKFAVNKNFAKDAQELQANDEVALLPPFAGG